MAKGIQMKFEFKEKPQNLNCVLVNNSFNNKKLKTQDKVDFELDFNFANFGALQYVGDLQKTKVVQKFNTKVLMRVYRKLVSVVLACKRKKIDFNNTFYVSNLKTKQNNNDIMLAYMLEVRFNKTIFQKLNASVVFACDFLDKENADHNMCDFKDNKCAKHRANNFERTTGCCPSGCKHQANCPCKTKNLSCKLIMCDYLMERGYYFSPHNLPVLRLTLNPLERLACWGMFFKTTKQTFAFLRFVRFLEVFAVLVLVILLLPLF